MKKNEEGRREKWEGERIGGLGRKESGSATGGRSSWGRVFGVLRGGEGRFLSRRDGGM
jgi:hypothetical protein